MPGNEIGPRTDNKFSQRTRSIDATRGAAMLLVYMSHFGAMYFGTAGDETGSRLASLMGWPASPTFIVLSGVLLGLLRQQQSARFPSFSWKMMDRGIFLLVPAHLLIIVAHWIPFHSTKFVFITDAVGVCMLVGPWLVIWLSGAARMIFSIALFALCWFIYLTWQPIDEVTIFARTVLIGRPIMKEGWITFPILPWLAAYVASTVLGESIAHWQASPRGSAKPLAITAIGAICLGVSFHIFGHGGTQTAREAFSILTTAGFVRCLRHGGVRP
jgi:uncharacterized membrane protein